MSSKSLCRIKMKNKSLTNCKNEVMSIKIRHMQFN